MKWIQTENNGFLNVDHVKMLSVNDGKVWADIVDDFAKPIEVACYDNNKDAHDCLNNIMEQLRDSKEVTIKAVVEEN